jgi:cell division septation protein DedD
MEQKQRLFIYERREVLILVLLGLLVAAFAFTLGVHLGKKVITRSQPNSVSEVAQTGTLQDNLPNKQELTEQGRNAQTAADAELSQSLHDEVEKTGVQLKTPRQVDLPTKTQSKTGGATTLKNLKRGGGEAVTASSTLNGKFTLQIGSFPSAEDAKSRMDELKTQGLKPFVKSAQVKGMGQRYRLFVGDFSSREDAENAGKKYLSQRMIESYLVSRVE